MAHTCLFFRETKNAAIAKKIVFPEVDFSLKHFDLYYASEYAEVFGNFGKNVEIKVFRCF